MSLPESQYVQNGLDRALIRNATVNFLPDKVRLNQRYRGVQGADWVHRMLPKWEAFTDELQQLRTDKKALEYLDLQAINKALIKINEGARPEYATDPDYKFLMRSLIVYRFLKNLIKRR